MGFTTWAPSPSPALAPSPSPSLQSPPPSSQSPTPLSSAAAFSSPPPPPSKLPVDFSPPLIAMVVVVAAAFLIVTYSRLISKRLIPLIIRLLTFFSRRRRRFLPSTTTDLDSIPPSDSFDLPLSPFGLDDSAIKTLPLSLYASKTRPNNSPKDCSVCLFEFEDDEYVRTLPVCSHAFHVDCIDVWLKSHANCPLCRAGIFASQSPFTPLMAARIRPSLDETVFVNNTLDSLTETPLQTFPNNTVTEITEEPSPRRFNGRNSISNCEERFNFVLKRSYSFGFERSLAAERMTITEPVTASPWRYRRGGNTFWSKRASPFGSLMMKPRVFSFRYYRGMRASPFFRRRGFFPLSESSNRFSGGGGGSSRRSKSMASPMFIRSAASSVAVFSSSRLRCGDPEALLSPERFNRR